MANLIDYGKKARGCLAILSTGIQRVEEPGAECRIAELADGEQGRRSSRPIRWTCEAGKSAGLSQALLDRLTLNETRLQGMVR